MNKKRIENPNYTQMPNVILDEMMCDMSGAEFKVVMAICRKTFGWHKVRDRISISQLMKITGLGNSTVIEATSKAIERGIIERFPIGQSFAYEINVTETCEEISQEPMRKSNGLDEKPVRKSHTQKIVLKEIKDIPPTAEKIPSSKTPAELKAESDRQYNEMQSMSADLPPAKLTGAGVADARIATKAQSRASEDNLAAQLIGVLHQVDVPIKNVPSTERTTARTLARAKLEDIRNGVMTMEQITSAINHYRNGGYSELAPMLDKKKDNSARLWAIAGAIDAAIENPNKNASRVSGVLL